MRHTGGDGRASGSSILCRGLIGCAGLHAERVARLAGLSPEVRIVPFRGEYYQLRRPGLVRNLIYPVPDPALPFLGVHLTRTSTCAVEAGPNAVLALSRHGYGWSDVSARDVADMLCWPGFWRLSRKNWRVGLSEMRRSLSPSAFASSVRRLLPVVRDDDLTPGGSGVRAQAVDRQGKLVDDFVFAEAESQIHVLNAPSPAATAALAIGEHLDDLAMDRFDLMAA